MVTTNHKLATMKMKVITNLGIILCSEQKEELVNYWEHLSG